MKRPIAYVDHVIPRTYCLNCAPLALVSDDDRGEIYAHDLDVCDSCPCDMCGTHCALNAEVAS